MLTITTNEISINWYHITFVLKNMSYELEEWVIEVNDEMHK